MSVPPLLFEADPGVSLRQRYNSGLRSSKEGSFFRCFFNDDEESPVLTQGILGYGAFTYSLSKGKVSMALMNNFNQEYPQAWEAGYADNTLQAKGVDGQNLELVLADEEMESVLNNLLEQNGSASEKYVVDNYKPKGVDHSQWMKQLGRGMDAGADGHLLRNDG